MRKLLKCRKALSPVVAAIILIAVTVAVSIAVAAWMGALSFTFMATEEITFTGYAWDTSPAQWINITVQNTGSGSLSIAEVRVSDVTCGDDGITTPHPLDPGEWVPLSVQTPDNSTYTPGVKYEFTIITAKGNLFGPYIKIAP